MTQRSCLKSTSNDWSLIARSTIQNHRLNPAIQSDKMELHHHIHVIQQQETMMMSHQEDIPDKTIAMDSIHAVCKIIRVGDQVLFRLCCFYLLFESLVFIMSSLDIFRLEEQESVQIKKAIFGFNSRQLSDHNLRSKCLVYEL